MLQHPFRTWTHDGIVYVQALPPLDNVFTCGEDAQWAMTAAKEALTGVLGALPDHGNAVSPAARCRHSRRRLVDRTRSSRLPGHLRRRLVLADGCTTDL